MLALWTNWPSQPQFYFKGQDSERQFDGEQCEDFASHVVRASWSSTMELVES
jgi:hypothetical protein